MTSEPIIDRYTLIDRARRGVFLLALWPPPRLLRHWGMSYVSTTASGLSDSDMAFLRRHGRGPRWREANYQATGNDPPLPCGHALAIDGQCTSCPGGAQCHACPHGVHLGFCLDCPCDTSALR